MNLRKLSYVIFVILVIIKFILWILEIKYDLYLIGSYTVILFNFIIIFMGFFCFKKQDLSIKTLLYSIIIVFLIGNLYFLWGDLDSVELYFESPSKTNTLIIHEVTGFYDGYSDFYQRKYFIFKKKLPYKSIVGYKNFQFGNGNVEWITETDIQISYLLYNTTQILNINITK